MVFKFIYLHGLVPVEARTPGAGVMVVERHVTGNLEQIPGSLAEQQVLLTAQLISLAQRCPRFPTGFRSIHSATPFPCVFLFSQLVDDSLSGLGRHKPVWGQNTLAAAKQIAVAWRGTGGCPGSLWARSRVTDPE